MVATQCVAMGVDWMAGDDDPGADDAAHPQFERAQNRPTKSGVSLSDEIPARTGSHNDNWANHDEYQ